MAEREPNDSLFSATAITSGTRTSGQLSSTSDVDYYRISSGSGTISVSFDSPTNTFSDIHKVQILDVSGRVLASEETGRDSTLATSVSSSGTYYIGVSDGASFGVEDASYSINVTTASSFVGSNDDHPDTIGSNVSITSGVPIRGELETRGDKDVFSLLVAAGHEYEINLRGADSSFGTLADPLLRVLSSGGSTLAQNDDGGTGLESKIEYTAVSSGTIFIEAGAFASNGTGTYQVEVTSSAANINPVAGDDRITVPIGRSTVIAIGANDSDANGDQLTTTGLTSPSKGTVSYTNNTSVPDTVTYTPFFSASGTDNFIYRVSDGQGGTDTATVTITFENDAPVAADDSVTAVAGQRTVIAIGANDSDVNGDELITSGVTSPTKGSVSYTNNTGVADTATYTANTNVSGTDQFTYRVSDGKGGTDTATVTVTLNTPPVAGDDRATATAAQPITINIGINDNDADGDRLTTSGFSNPTQGRVDYINNVFSADQVIYTAFDSASGTDSFTYQVDDGRGGTDTARVTVNLTPRDIPGDRTTTETIQVGGFVTGEHAANDFADFYAFEAIVGKTYIANIEGVSTNAGTMTDPLVAVYDSTGQQALLFDDDSGVGLNGSLISEVYVSGTYYLASISTSNNDFSTGTYKLSLNEINTIPIALDDTAFVDAGDTVRINIGLNDTDGNSEDFLSSSGVTQPSKGTVTYSPDIIAGINTTFYDFVDYTANPGAFGTDSFIYQVSDGKGGTDTATVTVNINSSVTTTSSPGAEVYRFFNTDNEKHFYTQNEFEANSILQNLPHYRLDGPAFKVANPENGPVVDVYRLYNTQSGTHLFTIDTNERDTVLATLDNFVYEGIAYQAHNEPLADTLPLYRFFHTQTGNHFYTTNEAERLDIELNQSPPYNSEGIKWYVDAPTPMPTLFAPPEDQPITNPGGVFTGISGFDSIGGGDGGA